MSFTDIANRLPRYRCIKCVSAAKIIAVQVQIGGGVMLNLELPDDGIAKIFMNGDWNYKHSPETGGYLVMYEDGYTSYSPADAFEKGYVLLTENEGSEL